MASDFDRAEFINGLKAAVSETDRAAQLGIELAKQNPKRLFLVGCGAPNREMQVIRYWVEREARNLEVRTYFPAEFHQQNTPKIDKDTIVILGSHSGTTPEVVQAAEYLQKTTCLTIGITQKAESPLARNVQHPLLYGESQHGYFAMYILLQSFTSALLRELENWCLFDKVMTSLNALPEALADVIEASEKRAIEESRLYKDDRIIYEIGSGPCFSTAYVFGVCILMEMQWMHSYPIEAAEYFHGPFEIVDQNTPIIHLLGEDPSRPIAERALRFSKKYTERLIVYDSKDYEMKGIDPEVRAIVAPFVLQAALDRLAQHLAVWHNHPLSTRRYMWKTEY